MPGFYEMFVNPDTNHVVIEVGNQFTEEEANGRAVDFVTDNNLNYMPPDQRFNIFLSKDSAKKMLGYLQKSIDCLDENGKTSDDAAPYLSFEEHGQ